MLTAPIPTNWETTGVAQHSAPALRGSVDPPQLHCRQTDRQSHTSSAVWVTSGSVSNEPIGICSKKSFF